MIEKLQLVFIIKNKDIGKKLSFTYTSKYTVATVKLL